jgi:hypothetical protein
MKTIHHTWVKQDGFKHSKCSRCNCTKKWSEGWQRLIYIDRFDKLHLTTPSCILPNTLL